MATTRRSIPTLAISLLLAIVLVRSLPQARADEVPLSLWHDESHPAGLDVGAANGVSWGDYDADGWVDLFACRPKSAATSACGRSATRRR